MFSGLNGRSDGRMFRRLGESSLSWLFSLEADLIAETSLDEPFVTGDLDFSQAVLAEANYRAPCTCCKYGANVIRCMAEGTCRAVLPSHPEPSSTHRPRVNN